MHLGAIQVANLGFELYFTQIQFGYFDQFRLSEVEIKVRKNKRTYFIQISKPFHNCLLKRTSPATGCGRRLGCLLLPPRAGLLVSEKRFG